MSSLRSVVKKLVQIIGEQKEMSSNELQPTFNVQKMINDLLLKVAMSAKENSGIVHNEMHCRQRGNLLLCLPIWNAY